MNFAFYFNLRHYTMDLASLAATSRGQGLTLVHFSAQLERFVWDRGCARRDCVARVKGVLGAV